MLENDSNVRVRDDLETIYNAAVEAVEPGALIAGALAGASPETAEVPSIVNDAPRIFLVAIGKAARAMALEAERLLARIAETIAVVPEGLAQPVANSRIKFVAGSHPLPDERSVTAAETALAMLSRTQRDDLVIVALSGGASAMFAKPVTDVSLAAKIAITQALLRAGASIRELNLVRKHLSQVKGGRLLRAMNGARVLTMILSDVPGNDLATIGSGLTAVDPTTFADAIAVLKRRGLWGRAPEPVRDHLERGVAGEFEETIKSGDPALARVTNVIIGDNATALDAAERAARELGYSTRRGPDLSGEASAVARTLARDLNSIREPKVCVLAGGEPVVTVRGAGQGGRAQHLALALALEQGTNTGARVAALCAGTDGIDGPTDAAGAYVFPDTLARAQSLALSAPDALRRADTYNFFKPLGDSLITGPTGTNVTDVFVGLVNYG
jgi:glycerate 2-kinase